MECNDSCLRSCVSFVLPKIKKEKKERYYLHSEFFRYHLVPGDQRKKGIKPLHTHSVLTLFLAGYIYCCSSGLMPILCFLQ